jgi:hypothetical protein
MTIIRQTIKSFSELGNGKLREIPIVFIDIDDTIVYQNPNWKAISNKKYAQKLVAIFNDTRAMFRNHERFDPNIKLEHVIYLAKHHHALFVEPQTPDIIIKEVAKERVVCILTSGRPCLLKTRPLKNAKIFNPVFFAYSKNKGECIESIVKYLQRYKINVKSAALIDNHTHKLDSFGKAFEDQPEFKKHLILYDNPVPKVALNQEKFRKFWYLVCKNAFINDSYNYWINCQSEYRSNYKTQYRQNLRIIRRKMIYNIRNMEKNAA